MTLRNTTHRPEGSHVGVVPEWVQDAVFYQIFPDRFARSPEYQAGAVLQPWGSRPTLRGFQGGNLRGIAEALPWICSLGCNALYLCPVFASGANHRYHTQDYFRIDPLLGNDQEFDLLVKECHKRGVRLVLDGVFNHASRGILQFHSLLECGKESPYRDWFHIKGWPLRAYGRSKPNYECWWGIPDLPKWNTSNPAVREFLLSVGEYWVRKGIDGWRLDVPNEIDDDSFWREFRNRVKSINPEAWIVGEIWEDPARWLAGDQFDGVMHYTARKAILRFLFPGAFQGGTGGTSSEFAHGLSAQEFSEELRRVHPSGRFGVNLGLLGSHDNPRIATLAKGVSDRLPAAWAMLFSLPATPCLYAGDELGVAGGKDPDNRRAFPWKKAGSRAEDHYASAASAVAPSVVDWKRAGASCHAGRPEEWIRSWAALRRQSVVLRHGDFACAVRDGGIVIARRAAGRELVTVVGVPGIVRSSLPEGAEVHCAYQYQDGVLGQGGVLAYEIPASRSIS